MTLDTPTVSDIFAGKLDSSHVLLRGWLHHIRSSGGILFLQLRDGTGKRAAEAAQMVHQKAPRRLADKKGLRACEDTEKYGS